MGAEKAQVVERSSYTLRWVVPWFRCHEASEDYACDHCGETIYEGDQYYRRIGFMIVRKREYRVIERTHAYPSCK